MIAAAHAHSVYGKALSSMRQPLLPLTQDTFALDDDHVIFDDYTGVVLDPEEGKKIAHALGETRRPRSCATTGCAPWVTA